MNRLAVGSPLERIKEWLALAKATLPGSWFGPDAYASLEPGRASFVMNSLLFRLIAVVRLPRAGHARTALCLAAGEHRARHQLVGDQHRAAGAGVGTDPAPTLRPAAVIPGGDDVGDFLRRLAAVWPAGAAAGLGAPAHRRADPGVRVGQYLVHGLSAGRGAARQARAGIGGGGQPGERQLAAAALGLGWKLALAPPACWLLVRTVGVGGMVLTVGVLQAAMAPMISAAILADEYGLEPPLANTVLGAGIVLSLLTVPLGDWLLGVARVGRNSAAYSAFRVASLPPLHSRHAALRSC